MEQFLSIAELVAETGLEESLIRFYESEYAGLLPEKILRGDTMFFTPQAVEAFKQLHGRRSQTPAADERCSASKRGFARVIAVTSGKGGVGKSNIALNLEIAADHCRVDAAIDGRTVQR